MLVARQVGAAMTRLACRGVSTHTCASPVLPPVCTLRMSTSGTGGPLLEALAVPRASAETRSCAARCRGHTWVATCGNGDFGRLGHGAGTTTSQSYPTIVEALNGLRVKQVACGGAHTCAVTGT